MLILFMLFCFSVFNAETTTETRKNFKIEFLQKYIFLDFNLEDEKTILVEEVLIDTLSSENNLEIATRGIIKHSEINLGKTLLELDSSYG